MKFVGWDIVFRLMMDQISDVMIVRVKVVEMVSVSFFSKCMQCEVVQEFVCFVVMFNCFYDEEGIKEVKVQVCENIQIVYIK